MTDEQARTTSGQKESRQASAEAWRDVGQHFQALGESLAAALRTAWQSAETRQHLQEVQANMESMADKVSQAIREAPKSPELKQARSELEKAAQSARQAASGTLDEARPQLISALEQLRQEVDKLINRLEESPAGAKEDDSPPTP